MVLIEWYFFFNLVWVNFVKVFVNFIFVGFVLMIVKVKSVLCFFKFVFFFAVLKEVNIF